MRHFWPIFELLVVYHPRPFYGQIFLYIKWMPFLSKCSAWPLTIPFTTTITTLPPPLPLPPHPPQKKCPPRCQMSPPPLPPPLAGHASYPLQKHKRWAIPKIFCLDIVPSEIFNQMLGQWVPILLENSDPNHFAHQLLSFRIREGSDSLFWLSPDWLYSDQSVVLLSDTCAAAAADQQLHQHPPPLPPSASPAGVVLHHRCRPLNSLWTTAGTAWTQNCSEELADHSSWIRCPDSRDSLAFESFPTIPDPCPPSPTAPAAAVCAVVLLLPVQWRHGIDRHEGQIHGIIQLLAKSSRCGGGGGPRGSGRKMEMKGKANLIRGGVFIWSVIVTPADQRSKWPK